MQASTNVGLNYRREKTQSSFKGELAGCKYIKGVSWGASCLQTESRENQDGWSVNLVGRAASRFYSLSWSHELPECTVDALEEGDAPPPLGRSNGCTGGSAVTADAITFLVLDGHGVGGRFASEAVERSLRHSHHSFPTDHLRALDAPISTENAAPMNCTKRTALMAMLDALDRGVIEAQRRIEELNDKYHKDFGTTEVSVTIVNDAIISSSCGDSTALLIALPRKPDSPSMVVELGRRHHLTEESEIRRIKEDEKGRIIIGDGGVLRLIPAEMSYASAKKSGLSINMSRSLGHVLFKERGLCVQPDFTFLTMGTIPRLMKDTTGGSTRYMYRLPPLTLAACRELATAYSSRRKRPRRGEHHSSASTSEERSGEPNGAAVRSQSEKVVRRRQRDFLSADVYLLLLSDGVTDVFSSSCLLEMLKTTSHDMKHFAAAVTEAARTRRHRAGQRPDNCTCLVVRLHTDRHDAAAF